MHELDLTVNLLGLCDPSNLLFVLSAEERRALLKLLWGLVSRGIRTSWSRRHGRPQYRLALPRSRWPRLKPPKFSLAPGENNPPRSAGLSTEVVGQK